MAVDQLTVTDEQLLDKLGSARERLLHEIRKAIVGQDEVVEQVLLALFVGGHSIITGVPGLAKTLLVRTIADRKSTRLNSSHMSISYAVFCLKKKKIIKYYLSCILINYHHVIYYKYSVSLLHQP